MWLMKYSKKLLLSFTLIGFILLSYFLYHTKNSPNFDQEQQFAGILQANNDNQNYTKEKYEHDISLLTSAHKNDPHNEHYPFYLAVAYKALNNYEEAIKWSKIRIEQNGNKEEIWFAKFLLGQCYQEKGDWEKALNWYQEAFQFNPKRAEPLQKIASYYRFQGKNDLAYKYAKEGSLIPYPGNHALFVSKPVYDYQFDEELSISAYYTPFKEEGLKAANKLLLSKKVPAYVKAQARDNIQYYIENLKNVEFIPIDIQLPPLHPGSDLTYNPMNPSIHKTFSGYRVICRTVNYIKNDKKEMVYLDTQDRDPTLRTKNYLLHYDDEFKLIAQHAINETLPRPRMHVRNIEGLEDCRLVKFGGADWFSCTTCDTNSLGLQQIALCKLASSSTLVAIEVEKLIPLKGPDPFRAEKNWLPIVRNNELNMIYSFDPLIIYKPKDTGECETVLRYDPINDFTPFRGSAAPILFDDGYLVIIHEVYGDLNYAHRFLFLDKDCVVKKVSKPFTYMHQGIEFCCGMTVDHAGKNLVMTLGIKDREAYFGIVDLEIVRSLLEPLP